MTFTQFTTFTAEHRKMRELRVWNFKRLKLAFHIWNEARKWKRVIRYANRPRV